MRDVALIAWDFDGVLNRNICDGQFLWAAQFEEDIGVSRGDFQEYLFRSGRFARVLVGQQDILELVADWVDVSGCPKSAQFVLDYWFSKDCFVDQDVLTCLGDPRFRHVIATNNEARRAAYIATDMGFSSHIEHLFAAGPMGVAKPDPVFFAQIEEWSNLVPEQILLVDDAMENIDAAAKRGWKVQHFTDTSRDSFLKTMAT